MPEGPSVHTPPMLDPATAHCGQLIADVQEHLMQISKLSRAVSEALANANENFAAKLDKQVDLEFGKKERAMEA